MRYFSSVVVVLAVFFLSACSDPGEDIISGTDQYEANEVLFCLRRHGIDSWKSKADDGSISVFVSKDDYLKAFQVLKINNLPRENRNTLMTIFPDEGMFKSPTFERIRMRYGLETEMANSLELINGVREARVHIVIPAEKDRRNQVVSKPSASVIISHDETLDVDAVKKGIQAFVANASEGMPEENVSVSFFMQTIGDLIDCKGQATDG